MCHCYNEDCMDLAENRHALRTMVYNAVGREQLHSAVISTPASPAQSLGLVSWPGRCLRLDMLPHDHTACTYLRSRGYVPQLLGRDYDVSYCQEYTANPQVEGRIVVPIIMNGQMVGWQARPPYDAPGDNWKDLGVQKYYNLPGMNKRLMLYGFDQARPLPFCIVVEGVTDVWSVGPGAISLLGKTMSPQQSNLIQTHWQAAVIALDAGVKQVSTVQEQLGQKMPVVTVTLPDGQDPATIESNLFWDMVHEAAAQQDLDLLDL
jgi:hypothetical protein